MKKEKFTKVIATKDYIKKYVNVEEFLDKCKECHNYNKIWTCPGFDFDPMDIWNKYDNLFVLAVKFTLEDLDTQEEANERMLEIKDEISQELFEMEKSKNGSISLSAGCCTQCGNGNCTREQGKECRYPEKMRYSIEALGGNVGMTIRDLMGIELLWCEQGKLPEYYVLVGGLLY